MRLFRRGGRRVTVVPVIVLSAVALVAGCSGETAQPLAEGGRQGAIGGGKPGRAADVELATDGSRSTGVVAAGGADAVYNYGPAVMAEGGRVRMWWCSQLGSAAPAGDDILYAEAATADGPFAEPRAVLSGNPGAFDGVHTCDPSVLRVGGTYYLYYTGAAGDHAFGNAIGLATSTDGVTWTRANGGGAILGPARDVHRDNVYGAGQPSVVFLDGWYYLMFTDTTGRAAGWNGAGQFVIRSQDPAFTKGVEALGERGFEHASGTNAPRTRSVVDGFSADLMWVEALDAFAIAHETFEGTTVTFFDRDFKMSPFRPVVIQGPWQEGPGLVRRADGHAPLSSENPCDRVPLDVVRATVIGGAKAPTDLKHFGIDVKGVGACADPKRAMTVLDGLAAPSPARTMDLLVGGKLVRVDRRSVAGALATRVLDRRPPEFDKLPVAARLTASAKAVRAPERGIGLVLDDGKLWPVGSADVTGMNDSSVEEITTAQWDAYPAGSALAR
ncbi:beta-xylosidase [Amycolatopsis xylanica]|uniref:beta-xylosidase n=1 Tax=Amycolatopsis xylanica TaxID=589385 RepID=UPI0015A4ED8C|nr:beta-xylosidase [Amycolatopsis xylanica]